MKKSILFSLLFMTAACSAGELLVETSASTVNCVEGVLGTIAVAIVDGQPPFIIDVAGQTQDGDALGTYYFSNLIQGDYQVTVIDAGTTDSRIVTVPSSDLGATVAGVAANCVEGENGSITVTVTGGQPDYTVVVSDQDIQEGPGPLFTFSDLEPGIYGVKVTDNLFCKRQREYVVPFNNLAFETEVSFPDCLALPQVVVTVTEGFAPYTVSLNGSGLDPQTGPGPDFTFVDVNPGTYEVLVVDSTDCARVDDIEVPANLNVIADVVPVNCVPGEQGSIQITVEGGIAPFTVEVGDQEPQMGDGPVFDFGDLEEGLYDYSVTDSNPAGACVITGTAEVLVNTLETVVEVTPASFEDGTGGTITVTVSGGEAPYGVAVTGQDTQSGDGPEFVFDGLAPGSYIVGVVSAFDERCGITDCVTILSDNDITDFITLKYCTIC